MAGFFFPDHHQVLDDVPAQRLDLSDPDEAWCSSSLLLLLTSVRRDGNLFAPVVVNTHTGVADQVVLSGQDFPLRAPLVAASAGR